MASPVKPADVVATIPSSTGSICEKLQALWSLATRMATFWNWAFESDGTFSDEFVDELHAAGVGTPVGSMVFWPLSSTPLGYLVANGQIVSRTTFPALFAVYGITYGAGDGSTTFQLPNLSNRFPLGASGTRPPGSTGGAETVELVEANMPEMEITALFTPANVLVGVGSGGSNSTPAGTGVERYPFDELFDTLGNEDPTLVNILNPYLAGAWIIKT